MIRRMSLVKSAVMLVVAAVVAGFSFSASAEEAATPVAKDQPKVAPAKKAKPSAADAKKKAPAGKPKPKGGVADDSV